MSKRHSTFFSSTQNNKSALTLRENRPSHKLRDGQVVARERKVVQHLQQKK